MAIKKCKECGADVSSGAKKCPQCGKKLKHTGLIIMLVIVALIIIVVSTGGNNTQETSSTAKNTTKEKFTLQDEHSGSSDKYGMSYTIEGSIKNNTDKQYSYVQVTFNLYDADGAQIGTARSEEHTSELQSH